MTDREQEQHQNSAFKRGENRIIKDLAGWTELVVGEWVPGSNVVPQEAVEHLRVVLRGAYDSIINGMLGGGNWRIYKQEEETPYDEVLLSIAAALSVDIARRIDGSVTAITGTVEDFMGKALQDAAQEATTTAREAAAIARGSLKSRLRNHRIIIAMTESNWTVNTTHQTAILSVADPLENSVRRIADLIRRDDNAGARRLSREVSRLSRLPTSVNQGELINYVNDVRDRLATTENQGRIIAGLEERAEQAQVNTKTWRAVFVNTRDCHAAADGQTVPVSEPFIVCGQQMMKPGDATLGASLSNIINCVPPWQEIDAASPKHITRRVYTGKLITIKTVSGKEITTTVNHPMLGERGWISAHLFNHGDRIICASFGDGSAISPDVKGAKTTAEQMFNSFSGTRKVVRNGSLAVNFHGEVPDGDVDVVDVDRKLLDRLKIFDPLRKTGLIDTDLASSALLSNGTFDVSLPVKPTTSHFLISVFRKLFLFLFGKLGHSQAVSFFSASRGNTATLDGGSYAVARHAKLFCYSLFRDTVKVGFNRPDSIRFSYEPIVDIVANDYSGFVYNLHDEKGYYICNGIATHNCQCVTVL